MNVPLSALIFQGIPEQIAVVALAFVIVKLPVKWTQIISIGVVLTAVTGLIRQLSLPFGLHTIFLLILLFVFLIWIGKGDISLSLLASFLSVLALIIFETLSMWFLVSFLKISAEKILSDPVLRILVGEPQVILLFASAFVLHRLLPKRSESSELR